MTHRGHQGTRELLVGRRALAAPSPAAVRRVRRSAAVGQAVAADGRDGQTARKKELNAGSGSSPTSALQMQWRKPLPPLRFGSPLPTP